jgi:Peptidase family M28
VSAPPSTTDAGLLGERELRALVERLAALERGSGSPGEERAAELVVAELVGLGLAPLVERVRVHGTYWWPIGLPLAATLAAASLGRRATAFAGALAAALVADDIAVGRRPLRRLLPGRETRNVTVELGDRAAARTLILTAHYDAAHSGLVFHPELPRALLRRLPAPLLARANTTPPTMWGAVAGPALAAAASVARRPRLRRLGLLLSAGYAAAMADIGARGVVQGANDNASGVAALLSLAGCLRDAAPTDLRVVLLFTGSEESILEGMAAWARRNLEELPAHSTHVICLDTVGSPRLLLLEGEGMLRMRDYDPSWLAFLQECAELEDVPLQRGLRFRNATDGYITQRAGLPTAMLGSCDELKLPTDYHWRTDTPERVSYRSVADAARLCRRAVERLAR